MCLHVDADDAHPSLSESRSLSLIDRLANIKCGHTNITNTPNHSRECPRRQDDGAVAGGGGADQRRHGREHAGTYSCEYMCIHYVYVYVENMEVRLISSCIYICVCGWIRGWHGSTGPVSLFLSVLSLWVGWGRSTCGAVPLFLQSRTINSYMYTHITIKQLMVERGERLNRLAERTRGMQQVST